MNKKNMLRFGASFLAMLSFSSNASAVWPYTLKANQLLFKFSKSNKEYSPILFQRESIKNWADKFIETFPSNVTVHGRPQQTFTRGHGSQCINAAKEIVDSISKDGIKTYVFFNQSINTIVEKIHRKLSTKANQTSSIGNWRPDGVVYQSNLNEMYFVEIRSKSEKTADQEKKCKDMQNYLWEYFEIPSGFRVDEPAENPFSPARKMTVRQVNSKFHL